MIETWLFPKFVPLSSESAGRIVPMEGIRGFAAMLVFLVHFFALFGHYAEGTALFAPFQVLGCLGHTGVDLFFILSGYLIYGIVLNRKFKFRAFWVRRIRRLYPTFLIVFAVYFLASFFVPAYSKLPSSVFKGIVYVVCNLLMLPGMLPIRPMITVAWSLSYEWFFYLVVPLLIGVIKIRDWPWKSRTAFALLLSALCLTPAGEPYGRLALFGAGVVLWELLHNTNIALYLGRKGEVLAAALFIVNLIAIGLYGSHRDGVVLVLEHVPGFYGGTLFLSGLLLTLYSTAYKGFLGRIFSWNPLRAMGNMSYSYYLIHGIVVNFILLIMIKIFHHRHLSTAAFSFLFVLCFSATVLASGILYLSIEWPLSLAPRTPKSPAVPIVISRSAAAPSTR